MPQTFGLIRRTSRHAQGVLWVQNKTHRMSGELFHTTAGTEGEPAPPTMLTAMPQLTRCLELVFTERMELSASAMSTLPPGLPPEGRKLDTVGHQKHWHAAIKCPVLQQKVVCQSHQLPASEPSECRPLAVGLPAVRVPAGDLPGRRLPLWAVSL